MSKLTENTDLNLEKKISTPFSTPDGYFDELKESIYAKTILADKTTTIKFAQKRWLKIAVAAVVVFALIATAVLIDKRNSIQNTEPNIAITTPQKEINILPVKKTDINKTANEQIANNENDDFKKVNISKNEGLENSIQKQEKMPPSNVIAKDIKPKLNTNQPQDNHTNQPNSIGQIPYNQTNENEPLLSQAQIGGQSPIDNGAVVARKTHDHSVKIIKLCHDTCSVSSIVLKPETNKETLINYKFKWSNGASTFSIVCRESGTYKLIIYDKKSRNPIDSASTLVTIVPKPTPDLGDDQTICSHESFRLNANTYNEKYSYRWSYGDSKTQELFIKHLAPGIYPISVTVTACGIDFTDEFTLTVNDCILQFSNVITPNGDGKNDLFIISGLENYPGSSLYIMDRNGKAVYESLNYQNNWSGDNLPEGTYFYLLRIKDGKNTEKGGSLTIIR